MAGMHTSTNTPEAQPPHEAGAPAKARRLSKPSAIVPIREIGPRYREQVASHLLALDAHDRYLRFGYAANERQIRHYVEHIPFERDHVLGIFNRHLTLVAMAHLAFPVDKTQGFAEFGVSVLPHVRGRGLGARLFERAATHAVNRGIQTLYIHTLSENTAMLRIARQAGAKVERAGSESEAHLSLPAASFKSRMGQMLADRMGQMDYWLKAERKQLRGWVATAQEVREAVREGRHQSGS